MFVSIQKGPLILKRALLTDLKLNLLHRVSWTWREPWLPGTGSGSRISCFWMKPQRWPSLATSRSASAKTSSTWVWILFKTQPLTNMSKDGLFVLTDADIRRHVAGVRQSIQRAGHLQQEGHGALQGGQLLWAAAAPVNASISVLGTIVAMMFVQQISHNAPSLQLRFGGQRLPNHADGAQQPLHPHLWGERSWEDRGLQEDSAVLCRQLSEHGFTEHSQGQNAHVQSRPRGLITFTDTMWLKIEAVLMCRGVSRRLSATPKLWKTTTRADLGNTWTFSLTAR